MELINQHTKKIMEGCKKRAKDAGLSFDDETLEYIVTNRDLLELSPKVMIPTLYDYWVHDIRVLQEKGKYELYPSNPYETVINTRPAISFYNDNNPDWLNVMIFYHVLAHIDFFQNNHYYRHTWNDDFTGKALSDKRLIAKLRAAKGRWVDYIIEFTRGVDNLVQYYSELSSLYRPAKSTESKRLDFYFDVFIQDINKLSTHEYIKEIEKYNDSVAESKEIGEESFFTEVDNKYPEFKELFSKSMEKKTKQKLDVIQYLMMHSLFLNKEKNRWMKSVMQVVRDTSLFFQPQMRTKIMNEGWASYWHEKLFLRDDRITGHEVDFARLHAGVTSMPKVGLNPYALGLRLFDYIEKMTDQGKQSYEYQKTLKIDDRKKFNSKTGHGKDFIFKVRQNFSDFTFLNTFLDQDFATQHNLFVAGKRLNKEKRVYEYYIKSKKLEDYRTMVKDSLYHPPHIEVKPEKTDDNTLYLYHHFEEKPLVTEFIQNTMIGLEYLWGNPVHLETSEVESASQPQHSDFAHFYTSMSQGEEHDNGKINWKRVLYTIKNRKLSKKTL